MKVPICSICDAYILHDKSVAPEHTHRYLDCDDSCLIHHTVTFRACCSPAVPAAFREACTVSLMTRGEHRAARGDDAQRARYFCCSRASSRHSDDISSCHALQRCAQQTSLIAEGGRCGGLRVCSSFPMPLPILFAPLRHCTVVHVSLTAWMLP